MITNYDTMTYCGETNAGKLFVEDTTVEEFRKLFKEKLRKECKIIFAFIESHGRGGKKDTFVWSKKAHGWLRC